MSTTMNKQMETKVYNLVSCLADNYGFDADAAFEYVRWETDVDHVGEILKMLATEEQPKKAAKATKPEPKDDESEAPTVSSAGSDVMDKIAACKKNIALWQTKLDKGSCKDADKQREKIEKEKAKLAKLEAKAPKSEEKPVEKKAAPKKEEAKEKRIKRFSPVMAAQLKTALEGVSVEMNDKLKKEFQQFVEDLTDDDYRASGLADHMRAFAKLKAPVKEEKPEPEEDEEEKPEPEEDEEDQEEDEKPEPKPESNVSGGGPQVVELSLSELQAIEMTASVDPVGQYWDADNGRFVKGPDADEDEDLSDDIIFEGKTYVVGTKTGRVHRVENPDDEDNYTTIFAGFVGVGKFKGMKMP